MGSHPLWEFLRACYHVKDKPYLIGGVLLFMGYAAALVAAWKADTGRSHGVLPQGAARAVVAIHAVAQIDCENGLRPDLAPGAEAT